MGSRRFQERLEGKSRISSGGECQRLGRWISSQPGQEQEKNAQAGPGQEQQNKDQSSHRGEPIEPEQNVNEPVFGL